MKFGVIETARRKISFVNAKEPWDLYQRLDLNGVDHGVVATPHESCSGVGIIVGQFGLFVVPRHQSYFTIGRRLYAGNAILYGFNAPGDTVELEVVPEIRFLSGEAAELAIATGELDRPVMKINDDLIWKWPASAPFRLPGKR